MNKYLENRRLLLQLYQNPQLSKQERGELYGLYIKNLRQLAYSGHAEAQYDLAQHYEDVNIMGDPNPFFNPARRIYWYFKSANNNNGAAYNNLADLYERGDGCELDLNKALSYYKKSMDLGYVIGKKNYKLMLKNLKPGGLYNP